MIRLETPAGNIGNSRVSVMLSESHDVFQDLISILSRGVFLVFIHVEEGPFFQSDERPCDRFAFSLQIAPVSEMPMREA